MRGGMRARAGLAAVLAAALAVALLPGGPARGLERLDSLPCPEAPLRLAVMGDSLADGLWGAIFRAFLRCPAVTVLRLTAVSDGLARTAPEDWLARLPPAGPAGGRDVVVVQLGANDITSIRRGTGREVFGTEGWKTLYRDRVEALAQGLAAAGAERVFWFGLPVVGQTRLEPDYRTISALQAEGAAAGGAVFVDIHGLTMFGAEGFTLNAEVDGGTRQVRATDQVHFTELGYDLVAAAIRADLARLLAPRRPAGVALQ
jgi:hypothetical protein